MVETAAASLLNVKALDLSSGTEVVASTAAVPRLTVVPTPGPLKAAAALPTNANKNNILKISNFFIIPTPSHPLL